MRTRILEFRGVGAGTVAFEEHDLAVKRNQDFRQMVSGWADYAYRHQCDYESSIGDDGVLGEHWEAIGRALLGLLNGNTQGLDAGSLDQNIRDMLEENGFSRD